MQFSLDTTNSRSEQTGSLRNMDSSATYVSVLALSQVALPPSSYWRPSFAFLYHPSTFESPWNGWSWYQTLTPIDCKCGKQMTQLSVLHYIQLTCYCSLRILQCWRKRQGPYCVSCHRIAGTRDERGHAFMKAQKARHFAHASANDAIDQQGRKRVDSNKRWRLSKLCSEGSAW